MASKNIDEIELWEKELESLKKDMEIESQSDKDNNPDSDLLTIAQETAEEKAAFALFDEFLEEQNQLNVSHSNQEQAIKKIVIALEQVQSEVKHFRDTKDLEKKNRRKTLQRKIKELEKQESTLEIKIKTLKKELSAINSD